MVKNGLTIRFPTGISRSPKKKTIFCPLRRIPMKTCTYIYYLTQIDPLLVSYFPLKIKLCYSYFLALPDNFSLHRAYLLLRTLGMRQIILLDESNQPSGILTRKDLMGFAVEEKLQASVSRRDSSGDGDQSNPATLVNPPSALLQNGSGGTGTITRGRLPMIPADNSPGNNETTATTTNAAVSNEAFQPTYRVI